MNKIDGRTLTKEQQQFIRMRAIELLKTDKYSRGEIAEILGISKEAIRKWQNKYKKGGMKSLEEDGRKGHKKLKLLTGYQERAIRHHIDTKTPDELGLSYFLWSRKAIQELIKERYKVQIALNTVSDLMYKWNYTPQIPIKKSYRQKPEEVKKWLNEEYPKIYEEAKEENIEIHWIDETGIQNNENKQRSYSLKGRTPERKVFDYRIKTNLISSITNQGKMRFMIYKESFTSEILIKFLERLIKEAKKKIYIIMDNHPVHKSSMIEKWLKEKADLIRVYKLPSYSPELNPDERLNRHLKSIIFKHRVARNRDDLNNLTLSAMRKIQKNKKLIISFFEHGTVSYSKAS